MLLLGIDLGTSSVKVSVLESETKKVLASAYYPPDEAPVLSPAPGWAEQDPNGWWGYFKAAFALCVREKAFDPAAIGAIGIAYQMHGLVLIDKDHKVLKNAIIWSDSRAVNLGEEAAAKLGENYCRNSLLNSPGNFTAAKLAWVKKNEPGIFDQVECLLLPGDYIALKLTQTVSTTVTALSEGIFYDFKAGRLSTQVMDVFGFAGSIIPPVKPSFGFHGAVTKEVAAETGLRAGTPVTYKAGDQPNNALSLNVLEPGYAAATAGTSGVIYVVTDTLAGDKASRINTFAHVNYTFTEPRLGVLLCINGTGSMNRWLRDVTGRSVSYAAMNDLASKVQRGSDGVLILPFGNGAERMLGNLTPGASIAGLDLNKHGAAQLYRAAQEGIAAAFRYGLDVMRENGLKVTMVRAGRANMFLSDVFCQAFADLTGVPVELYATDQSIGAALGAGIGQGIYHSAREALGDAKILRSFEPKADVTAYYERWLAHLQKEVFN